MLPGVEFLCLIMHLASVRYEYAIFSILYIKSLNQMIQLEAAACTAMITEPNRLRTERPGNSVADAIGEGQFLTAGLAGRGVQTLDAINAARVRRHVTFTQKYSRTNNRTGN
jgi:hypothetical protein